MVEFGDVGFSGKLRPSQVASSEIIREQLMAGEKNLHIVAPPGSGKTVLGLYTWSDLVTNLSAKSKLCNTSTMGRKSQRIV